MAASRSYKHILNGKLVPEENLVISVRDIGLLRGYGVFDFLITYNGKPFHLSDHIDRLYFSANEIGLSIPHSKADWHRWTMEALAANEDGEDKWIRMIATGGIGPNGMTASDSAPTTAVMIEKRQPCPTTWYEKGVSIVSAPYLRFAPRAKTLHYVDAVIRMKEAAKTGAVEILYLDDKEVLECTTANIFALINGRWCTPPEDKILGGITRKVLIEDPFFSAAGPVTVESISYEELLKADEVFITASNKEILPVIQIDQTKIKRGNVGPKTRQMIQTFEVYTRVA